MGLVGSIVQFFLKTIRISAQRASRGNQTSCPAHRSSYSSFPSIFTRVYSLSLGIQIFWLGFCLFVSFSATAPSIVQRDQLGSPWYSLPACVVLPLPLSSASGVGADAAGCLTGAAELGVDVVGPPLPVCLLVATMISLFQSNFAKSLKKRDCRSFVFRRRVRFSHTADHCYSLVVIQNIPDKPPKRVSACGVHACVVRVGALGVDIGPPKVV